MLWLSSSDTTLTILPIVGFFLAVVTMIGGPYTPLTFGLTWLIYLSLDLPVGLKFPWDSLLLEAGFLAQLLPSTFTGIFNPAFLKLDKSRIFCAPASSLILPFLISFFILSIA